METTIRKEGEIIQEIGTHKAVFENGKIKIYLKGIDKNAKTPDGSSFEPEFIERFPDLFKDRCIGTLPLENEDDLFAIFENFEETNRFNVNEMF